MASQHDSSSCPAQLLEQQACREAIQILGVAQQIPTDQQGVAGFVNVKAEDLPSSTELMSGQAVDSATIFGDELTARKYREVLLPSTGQQDGTIPRTGEQKRAHVRALFKAFKSVPLNNEEGDKMKEKFIGEEHNNHLVEAVCWELLEDCIRRANSTLNLVEAWEPGKVKGKTEQWTFAERFDHLVQAMATSKSICKHLFDVPFRIKLVDDPLRSSKRVASNRILNQKKAESLKRGREAEKEDNNPSKRPKKEQSSEEEAEAEAQVDNNLASQTTQQPAPPSLRPSMVSQQRPMGLQRQQLPQTQLLPARRPGSFGTGVQTPNMAGYQSFQPNYPTAYIPTNHLAHQPFLVPAGYHQGYPLPGPQNLQPVGWPPRGPYQSPTSYPSQLSMGTPTAEPPAVQYHGHNLDHAQPLTPDQVARYTDPNVNYQRDQALLSESEWDEQYPDARDYEAQPSSHPQTHDATGSSGSTQTEYDHYQG